MAAENDADNVADPSRCNEAMESSPAPPDSTEGPSSADDPSAVDPILEWRDVPFEPLLPAGVAAIPYAPRFATIFGLLAAARRKAEVSERALRLSASAIRACPADFNAWGYRMFVVRAMVEGEGSAGREESVRELLEREDAFSRNVAETSPKCYQVWEFRRALFELRRLHGGCFSKPDAEIRHVSRENAVRAHEDKLIGEECELVDDVLDDDEKNYHAWSHRTWLITTALSRQGAEVSGKSWLVEQELLISALRVRRDVRNNSAYAHRWSAASAATRGRPEMLWALDRMRLAPRNEAVWNYMLGLSREADGEGQTLEVAISAARQEVEGDRGNVAARRFLALATGDGGCGVEERMEHCQILATEVDVERSRYWVWKLGQIGDARDAVQRGSPGRRGTKAD